MRATLVNPRTEPILRGAGTLSRGRFGPAELLRISPWSGRASRIRLYERRHELPTELQPRIVLFSPRSREAGPRKGVAAARLAAHRPRVALAQPRREARARAGREGARLLAAQGGAHRGDPLH